MAKEKLGRKPPQYIQCKRCGRKIPERRQSEYCSNHCKNSHREIQKHSVDLVKEVYLAIANENLFSDEEIGRKLRSKEFREKFSHVLFIQDENKGDNNG